MPSRFSDPSFHHPETGNYQEECAVCLLASSMPLQLPCGHSFCGECVEPWLRRCGSVATDPVAQLPLTVSCKHQSSLLVCRSYDHIPGSDESIFDLRKELSLDMYPHPRTSCLQSTCMCIEEKVMDRSSHDLKLKRPSQF